MSSASAPDPSAQIAPGAASVAGAKGTKRAVATTLVGAVLTAALATSVLLPKSSVATFGGAEKVETLGLSQLDGASATLSPESRGALLGAARACQAPLAVMTLTKAPGAAGGLIRIRSGAYVSPLFRVGDAPQKIAVPFPTPYQSGRGQLWIEGTATGVELTLYPTWTAPNLIGKGVVNLFWTPEKSCAN